MSTVRSERPAPRLRDVTLRDGLQLTGGLLPVEAKLRVARALLGLGVPELEVGSFARPDKVPPMANTPELLAELTEDERERCWVWVATPGHVRRAADAGARNVQYCLSVAQEHNLANIGRTVEASLEALPEAVAAAGDAGMRIQLCLATAFTSPFEGPVDPDDVLRIVTDERTDGTCDVVIADTLGQATPHQVEDLTADVVAAAGGRGVVFHGHDTWGQGVANSLAAWRAGADTVDGALGGLGGCPFAPGSSGNTASEDLLFATRPDWLTPDAFREVVRQGQAVLSAVGEPSRSRAAQGAVTTTKVFDWRLNA